MPSEGRPIADDVLAEKCRKIGRKLYLDARAMRQQADFYEKEANAWEAKAEEFGPPPVTFRGMGHTRTTHDRCDTCGLNGQAFDVSKRNRTPIYCPMPGEHSDGSGGTDG